MLRTRIDYLYRTFAGVVVALVASVLLCGTALAGEVTYNDTEKKSLDDPSNTYVIKGDGSENVSGNYLEGGPFGKSGSFWRGCKFPS